MTAADVTVVVPVWGAHVEYLPAAIDSLLRQDGPSVEIVVVDNASETPIGALPDGVRVIRARKRLPVGRARNLGLRETGSPAILFWDADDIMLPGALARMWSVLTADRRIVAVTMDSLSWTPERGPGPPWPWPRAVMYPLARMERLFAFVALIVNPFTTTGPALLRTEAVRDAGGFPEDVAFLAAEDWALSGSLAVRGRVVMLREFGRWYRVHDESLTFKHLDSSAQHAWLRGIRRRARHDAVTPVWLKALLPLVWMAHRLRERRRKRAAVGAGYYESAVDSFR